MHNNVTLKENGGTVMKSKVRACFKPISQTCSQLLLLAQLNTLFSVNLYNCSLVFLILESLRKGNP